jgi:type I restriction enzyme M protein
MTTSPPLPAATDKAADVKSNRGRQSATPKADVPKTFASKIFATHEFGYRRITIERPLRLSAQFSDAAIESLRYPQGALRALCEWIYQTLGESWSDNNYGELTDHQDTIRANIKKDFADLKEKQIKDVFEPSLWQTQKTLMDNARRLREHLGDNQYDDFNEFDKRFTQAQKSAGFKLDAKAQKQLLDAITWKNPEAEPVIKKVLKDAANPTYGKFNYHGKVVQFEADGDLRDNENVPLNPQLSVNAINEAYFAREVQPHVPDAWINPDKCDERDGEIGIVGYEIPFNRHFYVYQPPRSLEEIDADLDAVTQSILALLQEVHS